MVTGTAVISISLMSLIIGGGGIFAYSKFFNGEKDWPSFSNSSFGFSQWEHKNTNDLIGLNFNFNSGGVIFEIGMILTGCFIILLCFCCGCRHLPQPNCIKERKHRRRHVRREKLRRKRENKQEEEEIIEERRRRKALRRNREHKHKVTKKISAGHWSTRQISEERKREILNEVHGEAPVGSDRGSSVLGAEEAGRMPSTRSCTSVWSSTSGGGSSWYGGSQIHHRTSLCTYNEGEEEGEGEVVLSDSVSVTSGDTTIDIE